ncbi:hypothetical protein CCR96_08360 [Halochromatium roseum]|nr:hypothetical protein [Halochromatium roseum]
MKYKVSLRRTDEGFSVSCPGLPGCWSQGKTEQEALENIADAITDYIAVSTDLAATEETSGALPNRSATDSLRPGNMGSAVSVSPAPRNSSSVGLR